MQHAFLLRRHALHRASWRVSFGETVAIAVFTFGSRTPDCTRAASAENSRAGSAASASAGVILEREPGRIGERQRFGELVRVREQGWQARVEHREHRAGQIGIGQRVGSSHAAPSQRATPRSTRWREQLHRVARVAARDLVDSGGDADDVLDVTENTPHQLLGLRFGERRELERRAELAQHVARPGPRPRRACASRR